MSNDVFVLAEHLKGQLADITFEMLGLGRRLAADLDGKLLAVLLGQGVEELAASLGAADGVLYVEDPALANFTPEAYRRTLAGLIRDRGPRLTLVGNTSAGLDLAAGLSAELDAPVVSYCQALRLDALRGTLVATSQTCGGKILVEAEIAGEQAVVSMLPRSSPLRGGASPADEGRVDRSPPVERLPPPEPLTDLRVRFKGLIEPEAGDVDITREDVLVAVGRGIGNADNLALADELAQALGGAVAASRPVVDQGWLPTTRQVGKSGMIVKPRLYLAAGVSGAPEHVEGMKDAGLIIAINTDETAPIFNLAQYGVVADLFDVLPALTERLRQEKGAA